jgi:hypothetical protein
MAKKKSASPKKSPQKKTEPMFPKPEQVAYKFEVNKDIPGSVIAEMIAAINAGNEDESRRMDLNGRLKECALFCGRQVMPYFGERPSDITEELQRMVRTLDAAGEFSDEIKHSLCLAIDLGILIQRCEAQYVFGSTVERGKAGDTRLKKELKTKDSNRERLRTEAGVRFRVLVARLDGDETRALKMMAGGSWGDQGKEPEDLIWKKNADNISGYFPK